ncbi:MAG: UDP-N-acetylmuramoyl-L-alanyl-D-glutamate--2,6-diaminopimelate ligase [Candidatus Tectomicrobia bacterium]|nr:UDP-N-acetylmuramoyl-L-alanyl-D-glutamate--2,6-diaminopimelate ligase [Candidatus Tectomicrobia bacterium]
MADRKTHSFLDLARTVPRASGRGGEGVEVSGVAYDSRRVAPGDLFVAVRGFQTDGHLYAAEAVKAGAVALALDREVEGISPEIPRLMVRSGREALALFADAFYGHPTGALSLVGVTGTNGKTTTAFLIESILRASGRRTGLLGTIHYRIAERILEQPRTTPEAPDLQAFLSEILDAGGTHAVMEVSSHGLALERVKGCEFSAAVFTNLTQDHLDFHGDMESYFRAKLAFFTEPAPGASIINVDDPYGRRMAPRARGALWRYRTEGKAEAEVGAENISLSADGMRFALRHPKGTARIETALIGRHNVSNILAASAACLALGLSADEVAHGVRALPAVPGRLERVNLGQPFLVVVDYAHTEDALQRVLEFARPITPGRLLTLLGSGGDRDRRKRPLMAAAAVRASDWVVMTSDNPRTEDPAAILREVEAGVDRVPGGRERARSIVDRREAVRAIIAEARPGDTVVVAGKGHETYQIVGRERFPFDDREEARAALLLLGYGK